MAAMTPVAAVIGPVGVGKTTVLREADSLLAEAGVRHATVEIEEVARFWLAANEKGDLAYRNLAALWANYKAAGANRLLMECSPSCIRISQMSTARYQAPKSRWCDCKRRCR